jgi:uncharacterized protein YneF (UPF0154 family)
MAKSMMMAGLAITLLIFGLIVGYFIGPRPNFAQ